MAHPTSHVDAGVLRALRRAAEDARAMHWAPYTRARVTAAVLTTANTYHGGSNVEVANISLSKHAEEVAVLCALAAGARDSAADAMGRQCLTVVYTTATPCGSCRQLLLEFAVDDCLVVVEEEPGRADVHLLSELLPRAFTPEQQLAASASAGGGHE